MGYSHFGCVANTPVAPKFRVHECLHVLGAMAVVVAMRMGFVLVLIVSMYLIAVIIDHFMACMRVV